MKRDQYLEQREVASFTQWLAKELKTNTLRHREFSGITDALRRYSWRFSFTRPDTCQPLKGVTYDDSAKALDVLQCGLKSSLNGDNDESSLRKWCVAAVKWGGVSNGNVKWFNANQVVGAIRTTRRVLREGDDSKLEGIDRFNAGMTKIYSLLLPKFIIYDSRVAAALAWFVLQWCRCSGHPEVPPQLSFACMPAKEGKNASVRKRRNPSIGDYKFPSVNGSAGRHAQWNLRASWVLGRALELAAKSDFHQQPDPLRALEAALFMWGYDLNESALA